MHALFQDWLELEGDANQEIIQSGVKWLDLAGYQDIIFYLDVRLAKAGQFYMHYQTAPQVDPSLFVDMLPPPSAMTVGTSPTVSKVLLSRNPTVPLAQLVRWRMVAVAGGGTWQVSFRIHCMAKRRGW